MRYKKIAEHIIEDIRSSKLHIGAKMPSLRHMAKLQNVSMTTMLNSYHLLEELGWIIAKPQSGFYISRPLSHQSAPETPQFQSQIKSLSANDYSGSCYQEFRQSGPLGISRIAPELMPTLMLQRSLKRSIGNFAEALHEYPETQGNQSLREVLSKHFSSHGFPIHSNDLVITNGCINAIQFALEATTKPGDSVAISSPCFSGLLELLALMDRKVIELPCTSEGIDLVQLEKHIQQGNVQAGLFSTSHMNPQGMTLSREQKQALAELANKYQFPVIEDDVYIELSHSKNMPLPAKYWDNGGHILWCSSVSKTLSPGFRVGWCIPGKYKDAMIKRVAVSQLGLNTPMQIGLADFINTGQYQQHLNKLRTFLTLNVQEYIALLRKQLPENAAISSPQGGTVLWLQIPNLNGETLQKATLENDLDIRIGASFTTLSLYQDCLRINTGWPMSEMIKKKLNRLCELIRIHTA